MVANKELLKRLATAAGAPGAEGEVREIVRETLQPVGEIQYDRLGSILCEKRGTQERRRQKKHALNSIQGPSMSFLGSKDHRIS